MYDFCPLFREEIPEGVNLSQAQSYSLTEILNRIVPNLPENIAESADNLDQVTEITI